MDKPLLWFVRIWVGLIVSLNVVAIVGFFAVAPTFSQGWTDVRDTYTPLNVASWAVELIILSPAIGAYYWLQHRQKRNAGETEFPSANL